MLLNDIKLSLRISHNALDNDIDDLIQAARQDLKLSGISSTKVDDSTTNIDPLIKRAIVTYVKANYASDIKEAERFQISYDLLKNHLSLAGDYTDGDVIA